MKKGLIAVWAALLIILGGCQEKMQSADTVVERHDELENEKRFTEFLANVQQGKVDQIRITSYTIEGAPIYRDLASDGNEIKLRIDTSKDNFGSGEIIEMVCTKIEEHEYTERIDYLLTNCSGTDKGDTILVKWME